MGLIVLGHAAALFMGLVLGLLGAGGSILTVPILVYLFHVDPVTATGLSLVVVGATSAVGFASHYRHGHVQWRSAAVFCSTSLISVVATRRWLLPNLPDPVLHLGHLQLGKGAFILGLFAVLMLFSAQRMIRSSSLSARPPKPPPSRIMLPAVGLLVGVVTGLLGAGGGFLIVPALVLLVGMNMKQAVGTSLLIITLNSLTGVVSDPELHLAHHAAILVPFLLLASIGIIAGTRLAQRISGTTLRTAFGWATLAMGLYIIIHELYTLNT